MIIRKIILKLRNGRKFIETVRTSE